MAARSTTRDMSSGGLRPIPEPRLFSPDPTRNLRRRSGKLRTISGPNTRCPFIRLFLSMTTSTTSCASTCAAEDTGCGRDPATARLPILRRVFYVRLNLANPNPAPINSDPAMRFEIFSKRGFLTADNVRPASCPYPNNMKNSTTIELRPRITICATIEWFVSINCGRIAVKKRRSEEHTSELQSRPHLVCRLLLEKKKKIKLQDGSLLVDVQFTDGYNDIDLSTRYGNSEGCHGALACLSSRVNIDIRDTGR